jgi:hypothetical protein
MKQRFSFARRLASLFRRKNSSRHKAVTQPTASTPAPKESKFRSIEPLEGRIAPASLVDARTIQFTDLDGDVVTVAFSKDLFDATPDLAKLNQIFKFSDGTAASLFEATGPQQLQLIDLTKVGVDSVGSGFVSKAEGVSVTVAAIKGAGDAGDDLTNVGAIEAADIALGRVEIDGDLGQIDAGRGEKAVGLKALIVHSLYQFGATTQTPGTTPGELSDRLESRISGELTLLHVKGDLAGYVHVVDDSRLVGGNLKTTPAKIGKVMIEGSLRGNPTTGTTSDNTGLIESQRGIGTIQVLGVGNSGIVGDAGIIGGGGKNSGAIIANTTIGSIEIADSIVGGAGLTSGTIVAKQAIKTIEIFGDIKGGAGNGSGVIDALSVSKVMLSGQLVGGGGENSGVIKTSQTIKTIAVGGIVGGDGLASGGISVAGKLGSVVVQSSIVGDDGVRSGFVESLSGIDSIKVGGNLIGGVGERSGTVSSAGFIKKAEIGKIDGGTGSGSGSIFAGLDPALSGALKTLVVTGGIEGGAGQSSGAVLARTIDKVIIGTPTVANSILGGEGDFSGTVISLGAFKSISVAGSVVGAGGDQSGSIQSYGKLTSVQIGLDLQGGSGAASGSILANQIVSNGEVIVSGEIKKIEIGRDMTGATIAAAGQQKAKRSGDVAIGSVLVKGNVLNSEILAGYDLTGAHIPAGDPIVPIGVNADASISSIRVDGNWTASSVAAGVLDANGDGFGNADDAKIPVGTDQPNLISQIASIVIGGAVAGTDPTGDHFGFTAERIGAFKLAGTKLGFTKTSTGESFDLGVTSDVKAREITIA